MSASFTSWLGRRRMSQPTCLLTAFVLLAALHLATASPLKAAQSVDLDFFESRIRPVLIDRCYSCHNSADQADGSLELDHRRGLLRGGDRGPAIVPGNAQQSLLIEAMEFEGELRMPEGGPKLDPQTIADFRAWIDAGAPDPRETPPTAAELNASISWEAVRDRRLNSWQFHAPSLAPAPPLSAETQDSLAIAAAGSIDPIDAWIASALEARGLTISPVADRATLIRRLSLVLTGLPPTLEELDRFTQGSEQTWHRSEYVSAVDHYLSSPAFGERWARHWMDWMRYADSHGSEGDPAIPHAYRYRDYLIRAVNQDVPIDQLVREQIAGDLLPEPRINPETQWNESLIGLGHYRMVQHGFAPVDPADERMRFTDNQIDVVSKAFLGMTLSCARCHDHKFDPLSQKDFYAWYGIFASARPALLAIDASQQTPQLTEPLSKQREVIRKQLAAAWRDSIPTLLDRLTSAREADANLIAAATDPQHPLHAWREAASLARDDQSAWLATQQASATQSMIARRAWRSFEYPLRWSFTTEAESPATSPTESWFRQGTGLSVGPRPGGHFDISTAAPQVTQAVLPPGEYSFTDSTLQNGVLASPTFTVDFDELWIAVSGRGGAQVRFVVQNYPRVIGLLYISQTPQSDTPIWIKWDMRYWRGEEMHIELATAADLAVGAQSKTTRSWFGIHEVVGRNADQPEPQLPGASLFESMPSDTNGEAAVRGEVSLREAYRRAIEQSINAWEQESLTSSQALFLSYFVQQSLLPTTIDQLPQVATNVNSWREQEAKLPPLNRTPGIYQSETIDRPLLERGDLNQPRELVARGFLEAFPAEPFPPDASGRRELAEAIIHNNPLFARVMANRLWHHVFGRGIVATCDNFGHLGEAPTHPELLDLLALQLSGEAPSAETPSEAWSMKAMMRRLVLTRAFRSSAYHPDPRSLEIDPDGRWLSRWPIRRLEAEAIRDGLLAVSGDLDRQLYGPTVAGNQPRRSVYVRVQRNSLDPFLTVFDAPTPFTSVGSRPATNVPAQSLMLLNGPTVQQWARDWGIAIERSNASSDRERVQRMYREAFSRDPSDEEVERCLALLQQVSSLRQTMQQDQERVQQQIADLLAQVDAIESPLREELEQRLTPTTPQASNVTPLYAWSFESEQAFEENAQPLTLHGDARITSEGLMVSGSGWAQSAALPAPLAARSLEAWIKLANLEQQGGGVVTLESLDGNTFDSIVFGEQTSGHWMAGSNFFDRTLPFEGAAETEANERWIHLVWVYEADGTIRAYRDGELYGHAIRKSALIEHAAASSRVVLGLRHSPAGGNRLLQGTLRSAALFDRPLTSDEVRSRQAAGPGSISRSQLLEAMDEATRTRWHQLQTQLNDARATLNELRQAGELLNQESAAWTHLALTLMNLKEMIYLD